MRTFTIADPHNRENPIEALSVADPLMYHGTHSMFSPVIEKQGFCYETFNATFGTEIRTIVAACDELYFKPNGYLGATGFSDRGLVYFSASFRSARGYAVNVGGERIDGALRAGNEFLAFAGDNRRVDRLAARWKTVLREHGPDSATERVLANLR